MPTSTITYLGDLRTEMTHLSSKTKVLTDAPTDNHGRGEAFSPTDLVASALGSCMITLMGIAANTHFIDGLEGLKMEITKVMGTEPRRIIGVHATIWMPREFDEKERAILERAALTCPVAKSLHPDIEQKIRFEYPSTGDS
ncbi:MAG: OsmC family peroxiredoxin [Flavobacteriaceae bacterium]|nr:OsmC family peroxiredoxin [Flavobacteriaceae bacterium]